MNLQALQAKADKFGRVQFDSQNGVLVFPTTTTRINLYTHFSDPLLSRYFFEKGKIFIVERTGTLLKYGLEKLAQETREFFHDHYMEQSAMSDEAEDEKDSMALRKVSEYMLRGAHLRVVPIKGRTSDGFKIEMTPSLADIESRYR